VSSLIGVIRVKPLLSPEALPMGHSLLFAVGARPPHDGVRRARREGAADIGEQKIDGVERVQLEAAPPS
jgi:hypothetical protein